MQKQITHIQTNLFGKDLLVFFFTLLNQFYLISKNIYQIYVHWKTHYDQIQEILIKLYFYSPYSIYWDILIASLFSIVCHLCIQKQFCIFLEQIFLIFKLEFVLWTYYNTGINLFSYKFNYIQTNASTKWVSILDKE